MKNYWVCPDCEAVNNECGACGKLSYNLIGSKKSKLFIDPLDSSSLRNSILEQIIYWLYYALIFLSNLILKNYRTRLPMLIGIFILLFISSIVSLIILM